MEPEEINAVLQRASELHSKIDDAIARALRSEFLLTARPSSGAISAIEAGPGNGGVHEDDDECRFDGEVNAEAKSLGGIRDALETLEDQLECLQALQQQQKAEREAALAELEQSRRILLRRLKSHHGKEWEVIQEALAFAGEPAEPEGTTLQLPDPRSSMVLGDHHDANHDRGDAEEPQKQPQSQWFGVPWNYVQGFASRLFGPGIGVTTRAAIVVAGVLTVILFSEASSRDSRRTSSRSHAKVPQVDEVQAPLGFQERCPPGKVMVYEGGVPKCVVKERFEVGVATSSSSPPDVLFGRG